jgi:hypothetical protein
MSEEELKRNYRHPWPEEPRGGKAFRRLERLVRIGALLFLCGLVWYFSYDQGRTNSKRSVTKLELENISLREKLILAEEDLKVVKANLAAAEAAARTQAAASEMATSAATDGAQTVQPVAPSATDEGAAQSLPRPADDQARGRLTLRINENKAAFEDEVILTLVSLDSIDQEATVRIHQAASGRREAKIMSLGDLVDFEVAGQRHSLYLDQIRGNMAFFILDGLPQESTGG